MCVCVCTLVKLVLEMGTRRGNALNCKCPVGRTRPSLSSRFNRRAQLTYVTGPERVLNFIMHAGRGPLIKLHTHTILGTSMRRPISIMVTSIDNREREAAFSLGERDRLALINYLCRRVNRE